jgi:hypothetical protein
MKTDILGDPKQASKSWRTVRNLRFALGQATTTRG